MAEMTDNDVLSVLDKMDQDQLFFEQMTSARAYVRAVIKRFQQAQQDIPRLIAQKGQLAEAVSRLAPELESGLRRQEQELKTAYDRRQAELEARIDPLRRTLSEVNAKVIEAQAALRSQELAASRRIAELTTAITEKEKGLSDLKSSFEQFKREHGL